MSVFLRRTGLLVGTALIGVLLIIAWIALPLPKAIADPGPVPRLVLLDRHGVPLRVTRVDAVRIVVR
jgi:hypothetical protein